MVEIKQNLLKNRVTSQMTEARDIYNGNLWRNGKGLAVRKPSDRAKLEEVREGFATQNVIEEVVDRKTSGVLGREPIYQILPKSEEQTTNAQEQSINEMTAAIVEWWNKREMLSVMREAFIGASLDRRAEIRPFVPESARDELGSLKAVRTLEEALNTLHFEIISPSRAGIFLEEDTLKPYSVFEYEKGDETFIEVSMTDDEGLTHLAKVRQRDVENYARAAFPNSLGKYSEPAWYEKALALAKAIVNREATDETINYQPVDLDGKLFLYELDLKKPLVTEPMISLQKQISLDKTMQGRNTYTAGFRSKHWLNARPPQAKKTIDDPNYAGGKREETVNLPMKDGAGVNSFVQGTLIRDDAGNIKGVATPSVVITDPVEVRTFIESKDDNRAGILCMAKQEHVLTNSEAFASGFSRQQARAEYKSSLMEAKAPTDALGRWIIEFAMMFAANLTGRVEEFAPFRCDFNSVIDAGILSPEEKEDNRKAYAAGEISLETLMSRNSVEDTDAELVKIKSEDGYEINRLDKILSVLEKASGKLPLRLQIEFLVKSLGKEEEWNVQTIMNDIEREKQQALVNNG